MTTLTHNTATLISKMQAHNDAKMLMPGPYHHIGGEMNFIGCLTGGKNDTAAILKKFGLPERVTRLAEYFFDCLPTLYEKQSFAINMTLAVGVDGKNLSRVWAAFQADTLRNLPSHNSHDVVDPMIALMDRLAGGESEEELRTELDRAAEAGLVAWTKRINLDARAAWIAHVAWQRSAVSAVNMACDAWHMRAAWVTEIRRQRDAFLTLVRDAPIVGVTA